MSVDLKPLLGLAGPFGSKDLILYTEAALLGVKGYAKYYDNALRRVPVMFGANLPAFGWLDDLALEVEYYANRNMADFQKALENNSWVPRPIRHNEIKDDSARTVRIEKTDTRGDDWKWSLYASKVVAGHLKISGQVANDHLRTGGFYLRRSQSEVLSDTWDWYWMFKVAYYF
jgi:hypothetical protein